MTKQLDCSNYQGADFDKDGYPVYKGNRIDETVLELKLGRPILPGHYVVHLCGNKLCINPEHLVEDSDPKRLEGLLQIEDGRKEGHLGETNPNSELRQADVELINALLDQGIPQRQIAKRFNVRQQTISNIATGRTWAWLTGRGGVKK